MAHVRQNAVNDSSSGFTLVELMITLVIAAILLGIGVPSFRILMQNQRLTTSVNDMFAAINLTRAEAVGRAGRQINRVDMAPIDGTNWSNGWAVFIDSDNDQIPAGTGDQIIFRSDPIPNGITITTSFTDNSKPYISYVASGRTRTNTSAQQPQAGTITFTQGTEIRRIKINFLGRPRVCNPAVEPTTCPATGSN